jgi:hypothetical protein
MLKRLVIFAVLVLGFASPAHPKDSGQNQKGKAQDEPSPAVAIVDNSTRQTQADSSALKAPESHAWFEWSNWALVFVGASGVLAAVLTLRKIKNQAEEMRLQRITMQDTLDAIGRQTRQLSRQNRNMVAKERARVEIAFPDDSESMMVWPDKTAQMGSLRLNLKNTGSTVEYNIFATYDAFASEAENVPASEELFHLVVPGYVEADSWGQTGPLEIDGRFSGGVAPQDFYVYLRGTITYNDIFRKKPNVTSFLQRRRFKRTRPGEAVSNEFWESVSGSPENEST